MLTFTRIALLAAGLTAVADATARACIRETEDLALKSGYSGQMLVDGARRVTLTVTLDGAGNGSGTLTLDPNITDGKISTAIAVREIRVKVRLVPDSQQTTKGRLLYSLTEVEAVDGKEVERAGKWLLIRPTQSGQPCWLVFHDKDGKVSDVLNLDVEPRPVPASREC